MRDVLVWAGPANHAALKSAPKRYDWLEIVQQQRSLQIRPVRTRRRLALSYEQTLIAQP
jgi:hypothetical protein